MYSTKGIDLKRRKASNQLSKLPAQVPGRRAKQTKSKPSTASRPVQLPAGRMSHQRPWGTPSLPKPCFTGGYNEALDQMTHGVPSSPWPLGLPSRFKFFPGGVPMESGNSYGRHSKLQSLPDLRGVKTQPPFSPQISHASMKPSSKKTCANLKVSARHMASAWSPGIAIHRHWPHTPEPQALLWAARAELLWEQITFKTGCQRNKSCGFISLTLSEIWPKTQVHFYPHEHRFLLADQYFVLKMKMLHMVPLLLVVAVLARSGCHNKTPETTDGWL